MSARLIVRRGDQPATVYSLSPEGTTIGRDTECNIVIADDRISRRHAHVLWQDGRYVLKDLGSRNGVFLNGRRVSGTEALSPGDILTLPGLTLRFDQAEETVPWQPEGLATAQLRIDSDRAEVWVDGRPIELTAKEYLALSLLHSKAGTLVSKQALAEQVWPEYQGGVGDYNIDQLIFRLRSKIEPDPGKPRYLKTQRGLGYKFDLA